MTMTARPAVTAPAPNNRGQPWSGAGLRSLGCVGTDLGNGGTPPPGHYERRRDCLGPFSHDKRWRAHWERCLLDALADGQITRTYYAIGSALTDYSAADGHHVFPSHRRLADDVHCSRSTVRRALKRRASWACWSGSLYEFLLPADRLAKLGLRQPRPPRENNGGRTTP